jgi:hypothetical protein
MKALPSYYLVFGDLHGRILPAFRLATAWSREHGIALCGLLQVGDLGYFPDPGRLDKATRRHAERDPLELGAQWIAEPSQHADSIFLNGEPLPMWFVAGNHEDYEALDACQSRGGTRANSFCVDAYERVWCIRDGQVVGLPGGLQVGGLWGIDDRSPRARRKVAPRCYIRPRSATELSVSRIDVLLAHESPRDAVFEGAGSELITEILVLAEPRFAFFGHYHGEGHQIEDHFGRSEVFHLAGFELRSERGCTEPGSVGLLTWDGDASRFEYLDPAWLRTFTRHNWKHR